jgi:hypothetical protein
MKHAMALTVAVVVWLSAAAFAGAACDEGMSGACGADARECCWDTYYEEEAHPLRIIAYLIHPIGKLVEVAVTRPLHCLVSQPWAEPVFGYRQDPLKGY